MVSVGRTSTLIVGGLVVFLLFSVFVGLYIGFWGQVNTSDMSTQAQAAWGYVPDFIGYGGMLLGLGIFIVGILEAIGFKILPKGAMK